MLDSNKLENARKFCAEVKELAKKYDVPFFVVTDGASAISNNGCLAVKNARDSHIKWEKENGYDPYEDWSKENKDNLLDKLNENGLEDNSDKNNG